MAPVPTMSTTALFTQQPVRVGPLPSSPVTATHSSTAALDDPRFEYFECSEWEEVLRAKAAQRRSAEDRRIGSGRSRSGPSGLSAPGVVAGGVPRTDGVVHLVLPDGSVRGTQLEHHLVSAMLCQNPELFHTNTVQSLLASVAVYFLLQPFQSRIWAGRLLDWVRTAYDASYARATCEGARSEDRRFTTYMQKLLDVEGFRTCLITNALDHPRELRCPGLSKAILGMWMLCRPDRPATIQETGGVSAELLMRWRLGVTAEMFHRLGLSLKVKVSDCPGSRFECKAGLVDRTSDKSSLVYRQVTALWFLGVPPSPLFFPVTRSPTAGCGRREPRRPWGLRSAGARGGSGAHGDRVLARGPGSELCKTCCAVGAEPVSVRGARDDG